MPPGTEPYLLIGALLLSGWVFWKICRTIVRVGFFLLNAAIGTGITWFALLISTHSLPSWQMAVSGGLLFAAAVGMIASKIMRAIATAAMVGGLGVLAGYGRNYLPSPVRQLLPKQEIPVQKVQPKGAQKPTGKPTPKLKNKPKQVKKPVRHTTKGNPKHS